METESQTGGATRILQGVKMKKTALILILFLCSVFLAGCPQKAKMSADGVSTIPALGLEECLAQIKQTNPEMPDQDARDNCLIIDAVNKGDASICNQVSAGFKAVCLAQFE
jgi:hypothetical protein